MGRGRRAFNDSAAFGIKLASSYCVIILYI
jgi:hypothetical protein